MFKNVLTIRNLLITCLFFILQSCGSSENKANYTISASETSLSFNTTWQETSSQSIKVDVNFSGDGLLAGLAPNALAAPWLQVNTENITENSASVIIKLVNNAPYPPNLYKTKIRLSTGTLEGTSIDLVHHDIDISMLVTQLISFRTIVGKTNVPSHTATIISSTNDIWESSSETEWLNTELNVDPETKSLLLTSSVDVSSLSDLGLYDAEIKLRNTSTSEEFFIPVELGLDNIYLFADQPHISLVSTPNINVTESTIAISNNAEKTIEWTASTAVDWLTLTPLDGGNTLNISADISKINKNDLSLADILIESNNLNDAIAEKVSVSLFHSEILTEKQLIDINNIPINNKAIASSPSQPFVYLGIKNEINIFHLYTGELMNTLIVSPENTKIEQFVIHPTGDFLLAQAEETTIIEGSTSTEVHRYKVQLTDNSVVKIENPSIDFNPNSFVRLSGRYFVLTEALEFADENLKRLYFNNDEAFLPTKIAVSKLTGGIFAVDNTDPNLSKIKRFNVEVNDYTKEIISTNLTHTYHPELLPETEIIRDLAVTNNEEDIYIVSSTSEWISFDGNNFTDNGLLPKEEVILNFNEETQSITNADVSSNEDDVATYSVHVDNFNKPRYIRTIKTSPTDYETYINVYNSQQQLITNVFTAINEQIFNVSPVNIHIPSNAQHVVINDKIINKTQFNLAPFIPNTHQIIFNVPLNFPEDNTFVISLGNIDDNWISLKNADWIALSKPPFKPKELIVELVNYETIEAGVYHDELTVYDITNQVSATIRVTLNIE